MQDMDLDLLRCFLAVAELRSFTAAGARLGRSQPAVSVRIKKLEQTIDATLFTRSNLDVQLTERGQTLLPRARRLLEEGERLLAEMRTPSVSGRLRIGLLEYVAPHRIPDIMAAMQRKLPGAELHFRVGLSATVRAALDAGEIDLALALHDPASETSTALAVDPLLWVEGPNSRGAVRGRGLNLCLMQAPCIYRQAALETLSRLKLEHREVLTAHSVQSVRNAVLSGMGVSVLGASCLGDGLRPARHLQNLGSLPSATLSLIGNDRRKPAVAGVLREILVDHMGSIQAAQADFDG